MNIALSIIATRLAVAFLASGAVKLTWPKEKLAASGMGWAGDFSAGGVKAIGSLEVLGAVGLIPAGRARHRAGAGAAGCRHGARPLQPQPSPADPAAAPGCTAAGRRSRPRSRSPAAGGERAAAAAPRGKTLIWI
jgi:hypothetical protein